MASFPRVSPPSLIRQQQRETTWPPKNTSRQLVVIDARWRRTKRLSTVPLNAPASLTPSSGSANVALDEVVLAATAASRAAGVAAVQLDDAVSSSSVAVRVAGILSASIGDVTSTASAAAHVAATLARTIDDVVASSAASLRSSGTLVRALDDTTSVASDAVRVSGATSRQLDDDVAQSTDRVAVVAQLAKTLDDATAAATTAVLTLAQLAKSLDDVTSSAIGWVETRAVAAQTLDDATANAHAKVGVMASAARALDDATTAATAGVLVRATTGKILLDAGLTAAANTLDAISATTSVALDDVEPKISAVHVELTPQRPVFGRATASSRDSANSNVVVRATAVRPTQSIAVNEQARFSFRVVHADGSPAFPPNMRGTITIGRYTVRYAHEEIARSDDGTHHLDVTFDEPGFAVARLNGPGVYAEARARVFART